MTFTGVTNAHGPSPSQQHACLQYAVWQTQQEVTRPKARFLPTSPEKLICRDQSCKVPQIANPTLEVIKMPSIAAKNVLEYCYQMEVMLKQIQTQMESELRMKSDLVRQLQH